VLSEDENRGGDTRRTRDLPSRSATHQISTIVARTNGIGITRTRKLLIAAEPRPSVCRASIPEEVLFSVKGSRYMTSPHKIRWAECRRCRGRFVACRAARSHQAECGAYKSIPMASPATVGPNVLAAILRRRSTRCRIQYQTETSASTAFPTLYSGFRKGLGTL